MTKSALRSLDFSALEKGCKYSETELKSVVRLPKKSVGITALLHELRVRGYVFNCIKEGRAYSYTLTSTNEKILLKEILSKSQLSKCGILLTCYILSLLSLEHGNSFTVAKNFVLNTMDSIFPELMSSINAEITKAKNIIGAQYFHENDVANQVSALNKTIEILKHRDSSTSTVAIESARGILFKSLNKIKQPNEEILAAYDINESLSHFKAVILQIVRDEIRRKALPSLAKAGIVECEFDSSGNPVFPRDYVFYTCDEKRLNDKHIYDQIILFYKDALDANEHEREYQKGNERIINNINSDNRLRLYKKLKTYNANFVITLNPNVDFAEFDENEIWQAQKIMHENIFYKLEQQVLNNFPEDYSIKALTKYRNMICAIYGNSQKAC